ncbi:3636_t:CDS:2, partial [Gigaspora rosea]
MAKEKEVLFKRDEDIKEDLQMMCHSRESSFSLSQSKVTDNEGLQIVTACNG